MSTALERAADAVDALPWARNTEGSDPSDIDVAQAAFASIDEADLAAELARHRIVSSGVLARRESWSGPYVACQCSGATMFDTPSDAYIRSDGYDAHVAAAVKARLLRGSNG